MLSGIRLRLLLVLLVGISAGQVCLGQESPAPRPPLQGYVDMHAHPRSDLAFGREFFFGAPCGDIAEALGNCKHYHHRGLVRSILAAQTEEQFNPAWKSGKEGYPDFETWPSWCGILHQQMWVDWIERAHDGGLSVMVALAVGSHCMASAAKTPGPQDDKQVLDDCIQGIKDLVAQSDFMEIAYAPQDVRRIVAAGKLAVILGSEMDNIGNFYAPADHYNAKFNPHPSDQEIQAELDRIWDLGVRYIFPVHLNNTVFGGSALAVAALNVPNKFVTGAEFIPEQVSTRESGIAFHLEHPAADLNAVAKLFMPLLLPKSVNPAKMANYTAWDTLPGHGHRNILGITSQGKTAIQYMFRKGFMLDIDHMSEKMANEVLAMAVASDYPVNSGHNGLRDSVGNEGARTLAQYAQLKQIGGMIGMGHGMTADKFVRQYRQVAKLMDYQNMGVGIDANGFSPLPMPNPAITVTYDDQFQRCTTGNRTWDINIDGVAHYGLLPDYIRSWKVAGMTEMEHQLFMSSAEHFTRMWEKCEARKGKLGR